MSTTPKLTFEEIKKYNQRVPRYTSYPTVPNWESKEYGPIDHLKNLEKLSVNSDPISLYVHIPFCIRRCRFCACNVLITKREDRPAKYLKYLLKEIERTRKFLGSREEVIQLHFGGGTPTHFTPSQLNVLLSNLHNKFNFLSGAELSVEVHPSVTTKDHLNVFRNFRFNRLSMGVQDFDPKVQSELNRYQTYEETVELIEYARQIGFESINVDLIYGLPYQSLDNFNKSILKINEIRPDRIALYSYAHFPSIYPHHKSIPLEVIPKGQKKLDLFLMARELFLENDYYQIGFDHFTVPEDDLWKSFRNKTLRRNFMGYTTKSGTDLIAFGFSSINEMENSYSQNSKDMKEYEKLIDKYGTAIVKGHNMTKQDKMHKSIIMDILCLGEINYQRLNEKFGDHSSQLISRSEEIMPEFSDMGFSVKENHGWKLTNKGFIFARLVASKFDKYLPENNFRYSTTI